jgi:hypothetical protein
MRKCRRPRGLAILPRRSATLVDGASTTLINAKVWPFRPLDKPGLNVSSRGAIAHLRMRHLAQARNYKEGKFSFAFNVIPPVQSPREKFPAFFSTQITGLSRASHPSRGGVGHRHERRDGMRWTRRRARRATLTRTAKSCGSDAPMLASSCVDLFRAATVTTSRSPGRARRKP